jgi:hypothetical protein
MTTRTTLLTMPFLLLIVGCGQQRAIRADSNPSVEHPAVRGSADEGDIQATTRIEPEPEATSTVADPIRDAGADPSDASLPRVASKAARSSSIARERVLNHAVGELPAHKLRNCVPNAGATERHSARTRTATLDGGVSRVEVDRSELDSCWLNSECNVHRGGTAGSTDGQVSISCVGERCECSVTTYAPPEVHNYSFIESEPCRDVNKLLRERCGG